MTSDTNTPTVDTKTPPLSPGRVHNDNFAESLENLMNRVWREAGADRMVVLTQTDSVLLLTCRAEGEADVTMLEEAPASEQDAPLSLLSQVLATGKRICRRDAFEADPYFTANQPKAVCALPLAHRGQVTGVLYLESAATNVLTDQCGNRLAPWLDQVSVIKEQARLYEDMWELNHNLEREVAERRRVEAELTRHRDQLEELVAQRTEALEKAQKELVRKERLATLGQLIATVSHELRNPLGTVRGSVFIISQRLLGKDLGVERALDRAERNIVRCDRIIEDLLDYTRTQELDLQPVILDRWLEGALEEYLFPVDIEVKVRLGAGIEVHIEVERLRRCLINLLNNAVDAMKTKKGEQPPRPKKLEILSAITADRVEIRVTDSGKGIPKENLEKIFEPLFSTKSFGVGLGLPTVMQIMEQHGGGMEITSEMDVGTTAVLWLPKPENPPQT